jgi:hypothetical protein
MSVSVTVDVGTGSFSTVHVSEPSRSWDGNVYLYNTLLSSSFYAKLSGGNEFIGNQVISGSVFITGSNFTFDGGDAVFNGNFLINGNPIVCGSLQINSSSVIVSSQTSSMTVLSSSYATTASYAGDYTLLSEFRPFTASYQIASSSVSTRLTDLEYFSSSLDNTFATNAELNYSSSVLSSSIANLSSSYLNSSASFDARILNNSASIALLSGSYLNSSASFDVRILNNSSSIEYLSSSFLTFSSSYNTGSFTGSFTGLLYGTASWSDNSVTASYVENAQTASYVKNAQTASYYTETDPVFVSKSGSFATTGSNTFYGNQIISSSTDSALDLHAKDDGLWAFRIYNDTYSSSSIGLASWVDNTGISFLGTETNKPLYIYNDGQVNGYQPTLILSSSGVTILSSLTVNGGITGSLFGTSSWSTNSLTASYVQTAQTASYVLNAVSSSFSNTASYLNTLNQNLTFNGNLTLNGTASIQYLNVMYETASVIYSSGSNQFGDATNDIQTLIGAVKISGSLQVTGSANIPSITGSLLGTASYSNNAATASNILGGKSPHIPFFITDTTLATSSIYQSGSTSIIINQDANTTANPEALYVWQPSTSSFNVISGKGNLNNYLQLNIQNTNQGTIASSDVVATADNGNESTNYIDMGINGENFTGDIGGPNDAYLYSTGNHLHIGNASNYPVQIFAGGFNSDTNRKLQLSPNNYHEITGSLDISGSLIVRDSITSSLKGTASYASNALSSSYALTASYATTSSYLTLLKQQIILSGSFKLDPTQDPDPTGSDLDSTVLFQSSSNTALGYDLYVRQNGNLVKWKWIEGILETGLLYGGVVTYSGSNVFVSPGSGIIADHNATTGSEVSPMIEYVTWNAITQSIANIATQQVTYLYIDNNGTLQQQSTRFTSQQYHDYIPLGAVGHFDYTQVSAFGGAVQTAYGQVSQMSNFVDAFGPLKMSGYGLTGQAGSLRLSVGSGTSFIHGGFYANDPEFPSQTTTPLQVTASLARINRSGSVIEFDTNAGNFYTVVDPTKYDRDGDGTLANVGNGNWSIQRVFSDPKTGVLYVYYGQARYTSLLNALQYLPTDPFTEGDTFDFTTFIGFLVLKGNASDITDTANNSIINGGLFRGSGQGSGGGIALSNLEDLTDVSITSPINGQALIYDEGIWQNGVPTNSTSASYALTASYAMNGGGGGSGAGFPFTGSAIITGSLVVTGSTTSTQGFTGSLYGTASWASNSISASYASTASFLLGSVTSASYAATSSHADNFTIQGTLALNGTLTDHATIASSIVGSNNLFTQATGSRTSAFGKYTLYKGVNARAGEFTTVWNGTTTTYTDTSTTDIGNTADITFQSSIVSSQIQINAVAASSGWTIKMLTIFI